MFRFSLPKSPGKINITVRYLQQLKSAHINLENVTKLTQKPNQNEN